MQISFESFLLVAGGAIYLFASIVKLYSGSKTKSWPYVDGVILGTSTHFTGENLGPDSLNFTKRRIYYRYTVSGKVFKSRQISKYMLSDYFRYNLLPTRLKKFTKGVNVKVFYNPVNYADSVLENHAPYSMYLELVASLIAIGFGIWLGQFYS